MPFAHRVAQAQVGGREIGAAVGLEHGAEREPRRRRSQYPQSRERRPDPLIPLRKLQTIELQVGGEPEVRPEARHSGESSSE